jgi:glycosyltransferase involved in cell wall biosynthesis
MQLVAQERKMSLPLLSIIIPVLNDAVQAQKNAQKIAHQKGVCDIEVIIVDDGSQQPIILDFPEFPEFSMKVLRLEKNSGRSIARNEGVTASTGTYVNFLDVDCEPVGDEYVQNIITAIGGGNDLVFGHIEFVSQNNFFSTFENDIQAKRAQNVDNWEIELTSACFTVKRCLFDSVNGFDPAFTRYGFEDRDFFIRLKKAQLNIKYIYDYSILVSHNDEVTLPAYLKKFMLSGQYSASVFRNKHPNEYLMMAYSKVDIATSKLFKKVPKKILLTFVVLTAPLLIFCFKLFPTSSKGKQIVFKILKGLAYLKGTIRAV